MFKLVCSFLFCIAVGRWGYEELKLISPNAIPQVDAFLETITPTTHDKWPSIQYEKTAQGLRVKVVPKSNYPGAMNTVRTVTFPGPSQLTGL